MSFSKLNESANTLSRAQYIRDERVQDLPHQLQANLYSLLPQFRSKDEIERFYAIVDSFSTVNEFTEVPEYVKVAEQQFLNAIVKTESNIKTL